MLNRFLAVAIGPKIIVYNFLDGEKLVGIAFFDVQLFIVSLNSVRNWLVVGDVIKSVYFLRWKVCSGGEWQWRVVVVVMGGSDSGGA